MNFHASAPNGLAELLAEELRQLGATGLRPRTGGVGFDGDLALGYRVCLWSRLANRVLLPLARWKAADDAGLYTAARSFDWAAHMTVDSSFAIDCTGKHATITHSHYASLKLKDAIVDSFRDSCGQRPSVDTDNPAIRLHLHLHNRQAELSLDLAGQSLHRRGYRHDTQAAPLKENLAAALLGFAGWPQLAADAANLLDPMCGSGTLLIEAALIAGDIAPGLYRERFGLHGWLQHDAAAWQALQDEARQRRRDGTARIPLLQGFDWDATAVHNARENIARAGLGDHIQVEQCTLGKLGAEQLQGLGERGLVISNPPYGERLGDEVALRRTYQQLGELVSGQLPAWRLAVLTSNPRLAAFVNRPLQAVHEVMNGPLECSLYVYAAGDDSDAQAFANRLQKNYRHLSKMAKRVGTDAWRVYDADLPEYAFAIDIYDTGERQLVLQEYAPPKTIDALRAFDRARQVVAQAGRVLEVEPRHMHLRVRQRQKGSSQYGVQSRRELFEPIHEQGCRLLVNLTDYLDTGVFLDHRLVRAQLRDLARDRDFLNLFAYTCTASVYAAAGGARTTTSVDMSRTYLDWGQRNMQENGYGGTAHRFVRDDVMAWLRAQQGVSGARYDLVFIDPPTFSNSKRSEQDFDVQRDHIDLLKMAAGLLREGGVIVFSNNYRRFKLDPAIEAWFEVRDITRQSIPEDFARHARIHQCWELRLRR